MECEHERLVSERDDRETNRFIDLAVLLELGAQGLVVSVPGEASVARCQWTRRADILALAAQTR